MLPWAAKDLRDMRKMAFDRAEQRYSEGSKTKDLFYYLVRVPFLSFWHFTNPSTE